MIIYPINTMQEDQGLKVKTVSLNGIGKKYSFIKAKDKHDENEQEEFWALKDVSFEAYRGQTVGIIGRNGAGKTTLLNIIAQTISPSQGEILAQGRVLGLFNLGVGFQDELSGKENIFLNGTLMGAARKELEDKLDKIIEFSELGHFINMPLGSYSQGMRLRLGFSIIANLDFDILLIDEVLAVGDVLFQNKCFQKLADFKRAQKTLVITNQSMDLIERLCDRVALLDHGRLQFLGETIEGVNRYRALLSTEKFFVGPVSSANLYHDTKKWADDIENWGKALGTGEVIIDSVEIEKGCGWRIWQAANGAKLKIKVSFTARNTIKEPHFGVAIFRSDGVYCYGPNSEFDGYAIPELKRGKGGFILGIENLILAPGEYKISVAVWDKKEVLAFNYHNGYYRLTVKGRNPQNKLLNLPFKGALNNAKSAGTQLDLRSLPAKWGQKEESGKILLKSLKMLDGLGREKQSFMTNDPFKLALIFSKPDGCSKKLVFWLGIYREDGIYCDGITRHFKENGNLEIAFSRLPLLPGNYRISLGLWDAGENIFVLLHHGVYPLNMAFFRQDHGTVYLKHHWHWR